MTNYIAVVATENPPQPDALTKDDVIGLFSIIVPLLAIAVVWGAIQNRVKNLEKSVEDKSKLDEKNRQDDKDQFKELLDTSRTLLLTEIKGENNLIKQTLDNMIILIQGRDATLSEQRREIQQVNMRATETDRKVNDLYSIFNNRREQGNVPSGHPDYRQ